MSRRRSVVICDAAALAVHYSHHGFYHRAKASTEVWFLKFLYARCASVVNLAAHE